MRDENCQEPEFPARTADWRQRTCQAREKPQRDQEKGKATRPWLPMEAFMDDEEEGVAVVAPAEVEAPPEVVEAPAPAEAEPSPPAAPAQGEPVVQAMAMPPVPLLALGVAGVAVFLFIGRKLFRRGKKKLDSYGAFIEYIHLEPAADTVPPAAPLSLAGLRFAWKDM